MASNAALGSPGHPTSRTLCRETTLESSRARRGWGQKEEKVKNGVKLDSAYSLWASVVQPQDSRVVPLKVQCVKFGLTYAFSIAKRIIYCP